MRPGRFRVIGGCCHLRDIGGELWCQSFRVPRIEIHMILLSHAKLAQIPMQIGLNPVTDQRATTALERTAVEHDNRTPGLGQTHERLHIAAETGNARHLSDAKAIHPNGKMVGKLGGARATRTRVNQWFVGHGRWCLRPVTTRIALPHRAAGCGWSLHPPPAASDDFLVRLVSEERDKKESGANGGWVHNKRRTYLYLINFVPSTSNSVMPDLLLRPRKQGRIKKQCSLFLVTASCFLQNGRREKHWQRTRCCSRIFRRARLETGRGCGKRLLAAGCGG